MSTAKDRPERALSIHSHPLGRRQGNRTHHFVAVGLPLQTSLASTDQAEKG